MRDLARRLIEHTEGLLLLVILLLGIVLTLSTPYFLTLQNIVDLVESYSVTTVLALGVFVVLVAGGIDISFAATASVAQYATAYVATNWGLPAYVCIPFGLTVGLLLGCINAALIHYLRVTSIIITIATMSVYFALLMWITGGKSIYALPDWWSSRVVFFQTETANGDLVRITLPIVVAAGAALVTWLFMTRTSAGRQLTAMGGNLEAARRLGINIAGMRFLAYGYLGIMAGLGGLLQAHRVGESVPNAMVGGELNVLAAAVLGGASLTGGIGSVGGVLLGILLLAMLQNGLNLLGVSPYFFQIVIGLVILVSTSITGLSSRSRRRQRRVAVAA
ncbi:ABC transporter permease [Benzoatithermus flavus]|uniref:ABC transporter permease n=1 Tax=Benzoatithermus flavus TaxID=3108223 RepID=A0ABU8XQL6_9PROT